MQEDLLEVLKGPGGPLESVTVLGPGAWGGLLEAVSFELRRERHAGGQRRMGSPGREGHCGGRGMCPRRPPGGRTTVLASGEDRTLWDRCAPSGLASGVELHYIHPHPRTSPACAGWRRWASPWV